jgi:hypothetical protein
VRLDPVLVVGHGQVPQYAPGCMSTLDASSTRELTRFRCSAYDGRTL